MFANDIEHLNIIYILFVNDVYFNEMVAIKNSKLELIQNIYGMWDGRQLTQWVLMNENSRSF